MACEGNRGGSPSWDDSTPRGTIAAVSYDLHFHTDGAVPSVDALRDHFSGRPHWSVSQTEAVYDNPTSGVQFVMTLSGSDPVPLTFALAYARPGFFAHEAHDELQAVTDRFGLHVDDPQHDGMGRGPYTREGFLRGWNAGNQTAARVLAEMSQHSPTLPEASNLGVWRWNAMREAYMDELGSLQMLPCFVPTVLLMARESDPHDVFTAAVWSEAMAVALPRVDAVLSLRLGDKTPYLIPYRLIEPHLGGYAQRPHDYGFTLDEQAHVAGLPHHIIDTDLDDGPLHALLTTTGEPKPPLTRLRPSSVLDAELFAASQD